MELTIQSSKLGKAEAAIIVLPLKRNTVCLRKWALLGGLQHMSYWQVLE